MASLRKKRERYYLIFCNTNRKPRLKEIALGAVSRQVAVRLKSRYEDRYALGEYDPWAGEMNAPLFPVVLDFLHTKKHLSRNTVQSYKDILEPFARFTGEGTMVRTLTPAHIDAWLAQTNTNDATKHKYLGHLSVFWNWLVVHQLADENITKSARVRRAPQKNPRFLSRKEVDAICDCIRQSANSRSMTKGNPLWLIPVIKANVFLGLRLSEVCNLYWTDIDTRKRLVYVRQNDSFSTKSRRDRSIPITQSVIDVLPERINFGPVFTTTSGKKMPAKYLSRQFKKYATKAGVQGVNFHTLRHTACSWLAAGGASIEAIRMFAGHSTVAVTQRYMHLSDNEYDRSVRDAFTNSDGRT